MREKELDEQIDVETRPGERLRIVFARRDDRYGHAIGRFAGGEFLPLISTVEGDASQAWPASPPLQQLHIESRGAAGDVALLVGMAGRSHWSLSVEPDVEAAAVVFDAACRTAVGPGLLGSRYKVLAGALRRSGDGAATLDLPDGAGKLHFEPLTPSLAMEVGEQEISLIVTSQDAPSSGGAPAAKTATATSRWRYRIRFETCFEK